MRDGFTIDDVMGSTLEDSGAILLQVGDAKNSRAEDDGVPLFSPIGWAARPAAPTAGSAGAKAVLLRSATGSVAVGGRDLRRPGVLGNLKPGEACGYAPTGEACLMLKADGSISMYSTVGNTETGKPVFFRTRPTGFEWESPYGRGKLDKSGWHFKEHGGAGLDIGSLGMPAPLDVLGTYATLHAAMVNLKAAIVSLGPDGLPKDAVAKATPLLTLATALTAFCDALVPAIATAIGSCGTPGGGGPNATGASTFSGAMSATLGALTAAAGALPVALPSQSTFTG